MATDHDRPSGTTAHGTAAAGRSNGKLVEYEQFIEDQLRKTRSQVRAVDIATSLMTLAAGTLAFFLAVAVIDHWVVSGGLGFWGRFALFTVMVAAMAAYLVNRVLPLLVRRINPLYAAQTIERGRPTLKNALLNFLFLRANPGGVPGVVYQAVEEQAATNLAKVRGESAVDRTSLLRTGYVLAGILLVAALYTVASPKNFLSSIGRIVMPWADIGAPTRTAILDVTPGDAQAFRGQQLTISARILGLPADGKTVLLYSTADGQIVERAVEMTLGPDGYKHACLLPPGESLLQQNLEYRIAAGDAVSKQYQVQVVAAPTIVVRGVAYHYPKYTGLVDQRVEQQGDIRAIEGTEVTLEALANQDIQSAHVDFDCDATHDQPLRFEGREAKVTFLLALKDDRRAPEHASYQLIFKNAAGQQNPQPVRHLIEVTRDLAPEVQIVAPKQDDLELPLDAATQVEVVAIDPDFALAMVKFSASVGGSPLVDQTLLGDARPGQFVRKYRFEPRKLGLKVGDVVEYWATAEDNKQPRPNRTESAKRRLRIVSPDSRRPPADRLARNDQRGDVERQPSETPPRGGDNEHPRPDNPPEDRKPDRDQQTKARPRDDAPKSDDRQPPEQQEQAGDKEQAESQGDTPQNESAGKPQTSKSDRSGQRSGRDERVPADGSDDGDAIERILKHENERTNSESGDQRREKQPSQPNSDQQEQGDQPRQQDQRQNDSHEGSQEGSGNDGQAQPRGGRENQQGEQGTDGRQRSDGEQRQQRQNSDHEASKRGDDRQDANRRDGEKERQQPQRPSEGQQGNDAAKRRPDPDSKSSPSERAKPNQTEGQQPQKDQKGQQRQKGQQGPGSSGQSGGAEASSPQQGQGNKSDSDVQRGAASKDSPENQPQREPSDDGDAQAAGKQGDGSGKSSSDKPAGSKPRERPDDAADGQRDQQSGADGSEKSGSAQRDPQQADRKQSDGADSDQAARRDGSKPDEASKTERDPGATEQDPRGNSQRDAETREQSSNERRSTTGQGARSKTDPTNRKNEKPPGDQSKPDAKGGDGQQDKGNSGAGQSTTDTKGSPSPTTESKPIQKPSRTSQDDPSNKSEDQAHSAADDRRESDSEGGDSGDRSGGGKRGGGQKANKSGTGGEGQNTAADEGAGQSDESGHGEAADRAGDKRQAQSSQGKPGSQQGEGSKSRPSGQGKEPGNGTAPPDDSPQSDATRPSAGQPGPGRSRGAGQPQGGKPEGAPADQKWQPTEDQADEANLEYARKATDLALTRLKDELRKGRPDSELLDRLGWTRADLENFVKRWDQMRARARQPGEKGSAARKELDDTLRSLGLRPKTTSLKHNSARDDQSRGLKESRRTTPPAEYAEQSKAYSQGTARGEK